MKKRTKGLFYAFGFAKGEDKHTQYLIKEVVGAETR
jgi:hypothetical protein